MPAISLHYEIYRKKSLSHTSSNKATVIFFWRKRCLLQRVVLSLLVKKSIYSILAVYLVKMEYLDSVFTHAQQQKTVRREFSYVSSKEVENDGNVYVIVLVITKAHPPSNRTLWQLPYLKIR